LSAADALSGDSRRPRRNGRRGSNVTPITRSLSYQTRASSQPRLELRQLYAFVAVAEELHFGRAAERLNLASSPLSRVIRKLEEEMGVILFIRNNRSVKLTAAGEALLESSRALLALAHLVVARVESLSS
jgi:DNA-binding MarR family transcriptional regulator